MEGDKTETHKHSLKTRESRKGVERRNRANSMNKKVGTY